MLMLNVKLQLSEIKQLRKNIRQKRRSLTRYQLAQSEQRCLNQLLKLPELKHSKNIGVYLDAFGEVPTQKLILELFKRNKNVYLPMVCDMDSTLHWKKISVQHIRNQRFAMHRLGMRQAIHHRANLLDVLGCIIMPLVAFDDFGHRVGMGGGFYDRTLAKNFVPVRIGYSHDFQRIEQQIETQVWDQNLDLVCTSNKVRRFKR